VRVGVGISVIQGARIAGARDYRGRYPRQQTRDRKAFGATDVLNGAQVMRSANQAVKWRRCRYSFDAIGNRSCWSNASIVSHRAASPRWSAQFHRNESGIKSGHLFVEKRIQGLHGFESIPSGHAQDLDLYRRAASTWMTWLAVADGWKMLMNAFVRLEAGEVTRLC